MHVTSHDPIKPVALSSPTAGESRAVAGAAVTNDAYAEAFPFAPDAVALSATARDVQRIAKVLQESPEIREQRVTSATQAVISGVLNLKGEELARSLLSDPFHTAIAFA